MLVAPNGRLIGRLDPVFKGGMPIREAQIIQDSLRRVRVLYVPSAEYTIAAGNILIQRVRDRMGQIEVVLESVNEIPRGPNGKFRAVICNLLPEECACVR
jgi:phenylacetate-CoA ligase